MSGWNLFREQCLCSRPCWYFLSVVFFVEQFDCVSLLLIEGYFTPIAGSDVYYSCLPGSFTAAAGSSACTQCPTGSFAPMAATSCSSCNVSFFAGAANCDVFEGEFSLFVDWLKNNRTAYCLIQILAWCRNLQ